MVNVVIVGADRGTKTLVAGVVVEPDHDRIFASRQIIGTRERPLEHHFVELTYNKDGRDYELGTKFGHLAFTADDLDGVVTEVERRGWQYRGSRPETGSRYIFVKDPDGYDIEILQKK